MALISMDHVNKIYPNSTRPALADIDLHIDRGDFVFLVGASGSGKTSLLRLLLREEEATGGEIRVGGYDLRRMAGKQVPQYRRSIGFVFQDYKLLPNKTVWENVAFALEVIGTSRSAVRSLVPKVLKTVGLEGKEKKKPNELSGGEQQRVTIARAYVNHPQILLADEPTGNLDPTTSLGIMEVLDAINRTGTTVVMATHNEEIVNSMRKRVVELHAGHIVRDQAAGVYDSALYFPDGQVAANAHEAISGEATSAGTSVGRHSVSAEQLGKLERVDRARIVVDQVDEALRSGAPDEGIARLAQSVHAGKTGRYGEAFAPLEETLTWGTGLSLEDMEAKEADDDGQDAAPDEAVAATVAEAAVTTGDSEGDTSDETQIPDSDASVTGMLSRDEAEPDAQAAEAARTASIPRPPADPTQAMPPAPPKPPTRPGPPRPPASQPSTSAQE